MDHFPLVSIVIRNYNGRQFIADYFPSVWKTTYPNYEVILVDDSSTDDSVEFAKKQWGDKVNFKLLSLRTRNGPALTTAIGIQNASGKYVAILDNDTIVAPNWLTELIPFFESNPNIAAAQSKLQLMENPSELDSTGHYLHTLGHPIEKTSFDSTLNKEEPASIIFGCKGASMILNRQAYNEVGGIDTDYYLYFWESDLCWRLWLFGYKVVFFPGSCVLHKSRGTMGGLVSLKAYYRERNTIMTMIKNYEFTSIMKFLPLRLSSELVAIPYLLSKGKADTARTIFSSLWYIVVNMKAILRKRRFVQTNRKVKDSFLTAQGLTISNIIFLLGYWGQRLKIEEKSNNKLNIRQKNRALT